MDNLDDLTPIDTSLAEKLQNLNRIRALWANNKAFLLPAIRELQALGVSIDIDGSIDVRFTGNKELLAKVYRILRSKGYMPDARPSAPSSSWSSFWSSPLCSMLFYTSFSSTVCKRVKTGTKMVEQDVYEVQCETFTMAEIESQPSAVTAIDTTTSEPVVVTDDDIPF